MVMVLAPGEKIHVIHRRRFEKEPHLHLLIVDADEPGLARVTGHVFTVDTAKFSFFRRPENGPEYCPFIREI